jgi:hypothetical protein
MEELWYIAEGQESTGPFTLRDLDVKFRTSELASNCLLWQEGMQEWQPAFKIPQIRELIQEGKSEQCLTATRAEKEESDDDQQIDSELCYFNKPEQVWKVFKDGQWVSQKEKPTEEEL